MTTEKKELEKKELEKKGWKSCGSKAEAKTVARVHGTSPKKNSLTKKIWKDKKSGIYAASPIAGANPFQ